MARTNMELSSDDLQRMAKDYFARALVEAERVRLAKKLRPGELDHIIATDNENEERLRGWLSHNQFSQVRDIVAQILEHEGIELDEDGDAFQELSHYCLRGLIEVFKITTDRHMGRFDTGPEDPLFKATSMQGTPVAQGKVDEAFESLVSKFIEDRGPAWNPTTKAKNKANLKVCMDIIGADTPAKEIDRAAVRRVKETLSNLPPNWIKKYPDRSLSEVMELAARDEVHPMKPGTVNAYLGALSSSLSWAADQGYLEANLAAKIRAVDPIRAEDKRDPYAVEHLRTIFDAPIYRGMSSRRQWKHSGSTIERDGRFWLPLVALFTGMRLGELVALKVENMGTEDDIRVIEVIEAKTKAGERKIPVHPELMRCGFLAHVDGGEPDALVFDVKSAKAYGKFYRRFQISLGLTDPKLVFHSFRHNFADALRAAQIEEPIAKALLGHSDGSVTRIYGRGYPVSVLHEAMDKIQYEGLNLEHLYI